MKCLYCQSTLYVSVNNYTCHCCDPKVSFLMNFRDHSILELTTIGSWIIYPQNQEPPKYRITLDHHNKETRIYQNFPKGLVLTIPYILDVNPNNFNQLIDRLTKLIVFS